MAKIKEDVEAEPTTDEAAPATEPTKAELQDELRDAGLPVSGTKAELVERLDAADEQDDVAPADAPAREGCVVDDGTPHMGRAVDGLICSAHSNRYYRDGSPRAPRS